MENAGKMCWINVPGIFWFIFGWYVLYGKTMRFFIRACMVMM